MEDFTALKTSDPSTTLHDNREKSHKQNAEQKKSDTKEHTLCDAICINFKSRQKQCLVLEVRVVVTLRVVFPWRESPSAVV